MIAPVKRLMLLLPLLVMTACQATKQPVTTAPKLADLLALKGTIKPQSTDDSVGQIRIKSIKTIAYQWGVRAGMFDRYQSIQHLLDKRARQLDTIFGFDKFLIDGKILLPTVLQTERIFEQTTDRRVRTVNVSYTLDKLSRLVVRPPSWRQYLTRTIENVVQPHNVMFPRTPEETNAWEVELTRGWRSGAKQADEIFAMDFLNLQNEIEGMYRYRKLLPQNIVTLPKANASHYSVQRTADGKTINLNDVVYTLDRESTFTNTDDWAPIFKLDSEDTND